jgi:outer membrane protein assembly factor BamB
MTRRIVIAIVLALLALGAARDLARHPIPWLGMTDLSDFYCAGKIALAGRNPYLAGPLRSCEHALRHGGDWNDRGYVVPAPQPPYDFAPYAALSFANFGAARVLTALAIVLAVILTALALSRLGIPLVASLGALALSDAFIGIFQGQIYPFVVMFAAIAAAALQEKWDRVAAVFAALTLAEPQLGVPICVVLFIWAPRARVAMVVTLAAMLAIGTAMVGPHAVALWATRVIPVHALWQVTFWAQYSLTYLLALAGIPAKIALAAGTIASLAMLAIAIWLAPVLALKCEQRAFLIFVPAAFSLIGGSFVHLEAISAALPLALLLAVNAPRSGVWLPLCASVLLAVPASFAQEYKALFFPAVLAVALICIGLRLSVAGNALCVVLVALGLWLLAVHTPPPLIALNETMPAANDLASHQTLVTAPNAWREIAKVPTWAGLIALFVASLSMVGRLKWARSAASFGSLALLCTACSQPTHPVMGPLPLADRAVTPFRAGAATRWTDFRLGGGLNVVVVNSNLPRAASWRADAGGAHHGISSSPVVYRNLVLVASNDGALYAFDAATGRRVWRYLSMDELMTQPVYASGLAFVASGNANCTVCMPPNYVIAGSGSNRISAVGISTGRERWAQRLAGTGMPSPLIVGNDLVHADGAGVVLALDAATGSYVWHRQLASIFMMSSVVRGDDGLLYVSGAQPAAVYALRANDGTVQWTHTFSSHFTATGDAPIASFENELITEYLAPLHLRPQAGWTPPAGQAVRHYITALDAASGRLLWNRAVDAGKAIVANQAAIPLVYRGSIFEGSAIAPVMTALDARTGKLLWQIRTHGPVKGGIVALDGVLYYGDLSGYLWAVRARDGSIVGRLRTDLHFNVGSPIVLNDSLVDGSQEGTVIAVPLEAIRDGRN